MGESVVITSHYYIEDTQCVKCVMCEQSRLLRLQQPSERRKFATLRKFEGLHESLELCNSHVISWLGAPSCSQTSNVPSLWGVTERIR